MSKFTTEVRFICESESGLVESKGFNSISEILYLSAPKIFNFDFPIFDESYRLPLETKILRHYYTREISEETVGLWKLRLQDRLCMIMPYYNQLYKSELIKFNPLYNYDLTSDYKKTKEGENTATGTTGEIENYNKENYKIEVGKEINNENGSINDINNGTKEYTDDENINKSKYGTVNNDDTISETETIDTTDNRTISKKGEDKRTPDLTELRTPNLTDARAPLLKETRTPDLTDARAPLLKETRTPDLTDARAPLLKETRTPDLTDARAPLLKETRTPDLTDARAPLLKEDHRVDDTKWNYYSDTPQGSISKLEVENDAYLTNATKDTNIGSNVVEYTGSESTTHTGTETKEITGSESTSHTGTETKEWTGSESTSHTGTETKEWTGSESTSHTGTETKEWTGSESTSHTGTEKTENTGTETTTKQETITDSDTVNTDKTKDSVITKREDSGETSEETKQKGGNEATQNIENILSHDESEKNTTDTTNANETYSNTKNVTKNDNAIFTNTEDYIHHVVGKTGDKSYSKMLMEFRDSFLNIDAMIIKDLSNLFFGLWE